MVSYLYCFRIAITLPTIATAIYIQQERSTNIVIAIVTRAMTKLGAIEKNKQYNSVTKTISHFGCTNIIFVNYTQIIVETDIL